MEQPGYCDNCCYCITLSLGGLYRDIHICSRNSKWVAWNRPADATMPASKGRCRHAQCCDDVMASLEGHPCGSWKAAPPIPGDK